MKQKLLIFLLIFLFINSSFAQQSNIDSLKNKLFHSKEDTVKVNVLNRLAYKIVDQAPDSALLYSAIATELARKLNFEVGLAEALNMTGMACYKKGDYKIALEKHNASLKLQRELDDKKGESNSLNNIGNIYLAQGEYDKALDFHSQSLSIEKELNDKKGIASSFDNIGLDYEAKGDYDKALDYHLQCLKFLESAGSKEEIAVSYSNIGNTYNMHGDNDKALEYHLKSLNLRNEISDKNGMAYSLTNIANISNQKGDYDGALNYYLQAEPILLEADDKKAYAALISNIGVTYYFKKDLRKAIELMQKSLTIRDNIGDKEGIASCFINIGNTQVEMNDYSGAISNLKKGILIAQLINSNPILLEGYDGLSKTLAKTNDFKNALHYYQLLAQTKDSIRNVETSRNISEIQTKYETEKKDKEITQLNLDNEKITGSRKRILYGSAGAIVGGSIIVLLLLRNRKTKHQLALNSTENKVLRSQMNPHFIFNSLNSIDDYIHNNDIENSSLYINKFSRLMRMILEGSRKENEELTLQKDLEALGLYMQLENLRMKNKVEYTIDVSSEINQEQVLIPPMLLQPFVENAFKHAYEGIEKPKLEVKIFLKDEMIHCTVTDNGIGRIQKQDAVVESKNESLGLRVTLERLDIINKIKKSKATLAFIDLTDENKNAAGTKVELAVPVSYAF